MLISCCNSSSYGRIFSTTREFVGYDRQDHLFRLQLWYWKKLRTYAMRPSITTPDKNQWNHLLYNTNLMHFRVSGFIFSGGFIFFRSVDLFSSGQWIYVLRVIRFIFFGSLDSSVWLLLVSYYIILTWCTSGSVDSSNKVITGFIL